MKKIYKIQQNTAERKKRAALKEAQKLKEQKMLDALTGHTDNKDIVSNLKRNRNAKNDENYDIGMSFYHDIM